MVQIFCVLFHLCILSLSSVTILRPTVSYDYSTSGKISAVHYHLQHHYQGSATETPKQIADEFWAVISTVMTLWYSWFVLSFQLCINNSRYCCLFGEQTWWLLPEFRRWSCKLYIPFLFLRDRKVHDLLVIFRLFIALAKKKYLERLKCSVASRTEYWRKLTLV